MGYSEESTEEIRLKNVELLKQLIGHLNPLKTHQEYPPIVYNILKELYNDPFPKVKVCALDVTLLLAENDPISIPLQISKIVSKLSPLALHQHSKIRKRVFKTFNALIVHTPKDVAEDIGSKLFEICQKSILEENHQKVKFEIQMMMLLLILI